MAIEFTIDVIEQKKELLFVTGISLTDITLGATLTQLYQYGNSKKSKKQVAQVDLKIVSIIAEGEPVEALAENSAGMIALSGDVTAIEQQAHQLKWRKKSGRLIRTSDIALTLADN